MSTEKKIFELSETIPVDKFAKLLMLANVVTMGIFGEPHYKMSVTYFYDEQDRLCVIDTSSEPGEYLARVLNILLYYEFCGAGYEVRNCLNCPCKKLLQRG